MQLFFYKWLQPLLDAGRVFNVYPPLWQLNAAALDEPLFAFTRPHYLRLRQALSERNIEPSTTRFRGLGNIPANILSPMCIAPGTRKATEVSVADAESAIKVFEQLRQLGESC